jgi:hypothetical protein
VLVYLLAWKLFESVRISAVSALLFGLHPLANQTIIGAVHTNMIAHAAFLSALLMLMRSIESRRHWVFWLGGSVFAGWLGLMAYDSTIVVFGMMWLWLILNLEMVRKRFHNSIHFMASFGALSATVLISYSLLRHLYASGGVTQAGSTLPAVGVVVKNVGMYVGALLLPVDVILANEWFNTPLPSEVEFSRSTFVGISLVLLCLVAVGVGITFVRWSRSDRSRINYIGVFFILAGIVAPLVPVLLFQPRPSETYLYLPVAFYSILLSYGFYLIATHAASAKARTFYTPVLVVFITLLASATWLRNNRVFDCGETARRTLAELPRERLREGWWKVWFANIPGETATRRYGFYGFQGVDTIGPTGITPALQLIHGNRRLSGEIVQARQLPAKCGLDQGERDICVLVHSDGRLERVTSLDNSSEFADSR